VSEWCRPHFDTSSRLGMNHPCDGQWMDGGRKCDGSSGRLRTRAKNYRLEINAINRKTEVNVRGCSALGNVLFSLGVLAPETPTQSLDGACSVRCTVRLYLSHLCSYRGLATVDNRDCTYNGNYRLDSHSRRVGRCPPPPHTRPRLISDTHIHYKIAGDR